MSEATQREAAIRLGVAALLTARSVMRAHYPAEPPLGNLLATASNALGATYAGPIEWVQRLLDSGNIDLAIIELTVLIHSAHQYELDELNRRIFKGAPS